MIERRQVSQSEPSIEMFTIITTCTRPIFEPLTSQISILASTPTGKSIRDQLRLHHMMHLPPSTVYLHSLCSPSVRRHLAFEPPHSIRNLVSRQQQIILTPSQLA